MGALSAFIFAGSNDGAQYMAMLRVLFSAIGTCDVCFQASKMPITSRGPKKYNDFMNDV